MQYDPGPPVKPLQSFVACRFPLRGVAAADGEFSEVVVDQQRARIDAAQLKVVIEIPLRVGVGAGCNPQARDQRRKMPCLSYKSDARQVFRAGEHVAASRNQRAAKRRIEKIFLRNLPGRDLLCFRTLSAGLILNSLVTQFVVAQVICALPGDNLLRCGRAH